MTVLLVYRRRDFRRTEHIRVMRCTRLAGFRGTSVWVWIGMCTYLAPKAAVVLLLLLLLLRPDC